MNNRMREYLKKNYKLIVSYGILFAIMAFTLVYVYYGDVADKLEEPYVVNSVPRPDQGTELSIREIEPGGQIEQDIAMAGRVFSGISLDIKNSGGATKGTLKLTLTDKKTGRLIQKWRYSMQGHQKDGYCLFALEKEREEESGDIYTLLIDAADITGQGVIVGTYHAESEDEYLFSDGRQVKHEALCYQLTGGTNSPLKAIYIALVIVVLAGIPIGYFCVSKKLPVEWNFVILAGIIGMAYILAIPPWSTQDGESHFATAYAQSSRLLGRDVTNEEGRTVTEDGVEDMFFYNPRIDTESYSAYWRGLTKQSQIGDVLEQTMRAPLAMDHFGYIPQVAGISLGRLFHMTAEQIYFLGRISVLAWYCLIMYWAVRLIPIGKMGLLFAGLLPMTMQQAVSYNYDAVLNGSSFFLFAYLVYLIYDKKSVKFKDLLIISVPAIIIAQIKFIYLPIFLLGLAVFRNKSGGMKKKVLAVVGIGGVSVAVLLAKQLEMLIRVATSSVYADSAVENTQYFSMDYCIHHIVETGILVFRTLKVNFSFYVETMLGSRLGWHHEIVIPEVVIMGFAILLFAGTFKREDEKFQVSWKERLLAMSAVFIVGGCILFSLLLMERTPTDAVTIWGVQGRYFLPVLPLFLFACRNSRIVVSKGSEAWMYIAVHALQICTIINIVTGILNKAEG